MQLSGQQIKISKSSSRASMSAKVCREVITARPPSAGGSSGRA
jgi:hypothetical protein